MRNANWIVCSNHHEEQLPPPVLRIQGKNRTSVLFLLADNWVFNGFYHKINKTNNVIIAPCSIDHYVLFNGSAFLPRFLEKYSFLYGLSIMYLKPFKYNY